MSKRKKDFKRIATNSYLGRGDKVKNSFKIDSIIMNKSNLVSYEFTGMVAIVGVHQEVCVDGATSHCVGVRNNRN